MSDTPPTSGRDELGAACMVLRFALIIILVLVACAGDSCSDCITCLIGSGARM